MNNKRFKIARVSVVFLAIILGLVFFSSSILAQEVEYPQIPGAEKPTGGIPQYVKYIYNFIIILAGLIGLAALILGGIKYLISAGNLEKIREAKKQIFYGFLGIIIILSANLILNTINPELTFIRFIKEPPKPLEVSPVLPTRERPKTLIAYEIPLGKLMDGALIPGDYLSEGVPESDATYGKSITPDLLEEYKEFGDELEGKLKAISQETNPEKIEKLVNEIQSLPGKLEPSRVQESSLTYIEKISQKVAEIMNLACEEGESGCLLDCLGGFQCKVSGIKKLLELIEEFQNRKNGEIDTLKNELEKAVQDIKNILDLDLTKGTSGFSDLEKLDEKYDSSTENLVNEIVVQTKEIRLRECCNEVSRQELEQKITELQALAEAFKEGYQIRKDIWEVSKQSIEIKKGLDNYRTLQKANLKLEGSDYLYEGTVAESRLDRILDLQKRIRDKSNQIKIVSLTMNTAASVIATLTGICNCVFCACACGPCVGDPCAPVRPALIASQVVLAAGAATLPPLSSQLQKEVNKEIKEREGLEESVEKLTEGLEKAESILKSCVGKRGEYQLNLLSLSNFLDYLQKLEDYGYKIRIIKPWPEIAIENDPYTFYCVEGPAYPYLTEGSYLYPSSPFGKRKVICEREVEVGELMDSIESVVKDENQMLEKMDETTKSAQAIINEASKMTPGKTAKGTVGDLLKKGVPSELADKIPREVFRALSGEQLNEILKDTFKSMPEKYAKDLLRHIFENLPAGEVKEILISNLGAMSGKDLKETFLDYFSSLKNEEKKEISQAIFEGMADSKVKMSIIAALLTIEDKNLKEFWKETLERMGKEGRGQFFESVFSQISESDLLKLSATLSENLPSVEVKKLLREILENAPSGITSQVLEKYSGESVEEKIKNIPEAELKEVFQKTTDSLDQVNLLQRTIQGVPEDIWEKILKEIPRENLKDFTQILFGGISEISIKDIVFFDILEQDPNFLQRIIIYTPNENIKDLFLNNVLGSVGEGDLRDILNLGTFLLRADPRSYLNNLFLKHIPEGNKLIKAANIIADKTYDDFFTEAIGVMPELQGAKDMLDKISPYVQDVKGTINSVLDEVSLTQTQMRSLLRDILNQLPETKQRALAKEMGRYLPAREINKIINEVFRQLPPDVKRKAISDLLNYTSEDFRQKKIETLETLPDAELPELLNEVLKNIPKAKSGEAFQTVFWYIPDKMLAEKMNHISKYVPESLLRNYLNLVLNHLPKSINQVLDKIFHKTPNEILKKNTDKIFDRLTDGAANELMGKISSYLPDKLLEKYLDKLVGFAEKKLGEILSKLQKSFPGLPIGPENFGNVLGGVISGAPPLKQNALEMVKLPPLFTCAPCGCACPLGVPTPCFGMTPPGPYKEVLKRFAYILANNLKINLNQSQLTNSSQTTDNIIKVDIKEEIYGGLRNSRVDFGECFLRTEITPPLLNQLYKCRDAMHYGWVDRCEDPFNFFCCYPAE